jgi:hypothetical protein
LISAGSTPAARAFQTDSGVAISVNVLGRLDQLGETDQGVARLRVARAIDFDQDTVVPLDDQGVFGAILAHAAKGKNCILSQRQRQRRKSR